MVNKRKFKEKQTQMPKNQIQIENKYQRQSKCYFKHNLEES